MTQAKIFFVRHGQSEANVKGLFAGQREDSPLTDVGKKQAVLAARDLLNRKLKFKTIYVSPLRRTRETVEIIVSEAKLTNTEIIFDERIAEYDMGDITGTPVRKVTSYELISAKNAEDPNLFMIRVHDLLNELSNFREDFLLVSHAGVGRIIEAKRKGIEPQSFYDLDPYPNAKIIELKV